MDNPEEIMQILERFSKLKHKDITSLPLEIPEELEEYINYVARTGDPLYNWALIKNLFREKLLTVMTDFFNDTPDLKDLPNYPNVDPFNYETMKKVLIEKLDSFSGPPFTIQRICELLANPRKQYSRIDKFMRAVEKNILVVSTQEVGRTRTESENGDSMNGGDISSDVNVDIDMENENCLVVSKDVTQHRKDENHETTKVTHETSTAPKTVTSTASKDDEKDAEEKPQNESESTITTITGFKVNTENDGQRFSMTVTEVSITNQEKEEEKISDSETTSSSSEDSEDSSNSSKDEKQELPATITEDNIDKIPIEISLEKPADDNGLVDEIEIEVKLLEEPADEKEKEESDIPVVVEATQAEDSQKSVESLEEDPESAPKRLKIDQVEEKEQETKELETQEPAQEHKDDSDKEPVVADPPEEVKETPQVQETKEENSTEEQSVITESIPEIPETKEVFEEKEDEKTVDVPVTEAENLVIEPLPSDSEPIVMAAEETETIPEIPVELIAEADIEPEIIAESEPTNDAIEMDTVTTTTTSTDQNMELPPAEEMIDTNLASKMDTDTDSMDVDEVVGEPMEN